MYLFVGQMSVMESVGILNLSKIEGNGVLLTASET